MLDTGKQQEAFETFRKHTSLFKPLIHAMPPPVSTPPASIAAAGHVHWGWIGKQQRNFAKLLESLTAAAAAKGGAIVRPTSQYGEPGYYYQVGCTGLRCGTCPNPLAPPCSLRWRLAAR